MLNWLWLEGPVYVYSFRLLLSFTPKSSSLSLSKYKNSLDPLSFHISFSFFFFFLSIVESTHFGENRNFWNKTCLFECVRVALYYLKLSYRWNIRPMYVWMYLAWLSLSLSGVSTDKAFKCRHFGAWWRLAGRLLVEVGTRNG